MPIRTAPSIAIADPKSYDWNAAFDGATWFHVTGITPSLSEPAARATRLALETARAKARETAPKRNGGNGSRGAAGDRLDEVAIVRVEELYPFPATEISEIISVYPRLDEIAWLQEEPRNMGAWTFVAPRIEEALAGLKIAADRPRYVGRPEAASPATGLFKTHMAEQAALLDQALTV